jgi:protein-export membrane protein SecD
MWKKRISALILIILAVTVGYFVWVSEVKKTNYAFKLGLDLKGGTHLVYEADTTKVSDVKEAMTALRDVIERRVNLFGVSEPIVQVEEGGVLGVGSTERLVVELPGVTDVNEAVKKIGQTPTLDFRLVKEFPGLTEEQIKQKTVDEVFIRTGLDGRYLKSAQMDFDPTTGEPKVLLNFNSEGSDLFAKITKENTNKILAIFLDGLPISTPVIRQEITGGKAEITGNFDIKEAKLLVRNLNYGALPVPISLVSTQTIGATLGEEATSAGVKAGIIAFLVIAAFLIFWYRLPGFLATIALAIYVVINLALFKVIPVTLTAAGIAGFILSLGMAVDANVLIFERLKEELKKGKPLDEAMREGFGRAWLSIRDSNLSSIITAIILYMFASTNIIKGFALVFGIGVLTSMFTAISASRTLLFAMRFRDSKFSRFLFSCGILSK